MSIGAIGGLAGISAYYPGYSVSSINANPKSLRPVEAIGEDTKRTSPFAILKKMPEKQTGPSQEVKDHQTVTAAGNYREEMARMMSGVKFSAVSLMEGMV